MRLDEWQKFIEAQFLEETPLPPADSRSDAEDTAEEDVIAAKIASSLGLEEAEGGNTEPVYAASSLDSGAPCEETTALSSGISLSEEELEEPLPSFLVRSSRSTSRPAPLPAVPIAPVRPSFPSPFGPPPDAAMEIPAFESYLPARNDFASASFEKESEKEAHEAPEEKSPAISDTESVQNNVVTKEEDEQNAVLENRQVVLENRESYTTLETAETEKARRVPKSRARHARNVRPENVPNGLSSAELWTTVPRHIQTLLELERRHEEEVAQYSYKRPFVEKRRELLERILDPVLTLEETARLLHVCPTTVRRYTNRGILTCYRKEPENVSVREETSERETRQRRFRLSDILTFLETQRAALEADQRRDASALTQAETDANGIGMDANNIGKETED